MSLIGGTAWLLIGCLVLLAGTIQSAELPDKEWWETTLVYQIWPRGFQDSDGDGEGDLQGIIHRLDYIQDLGVETIWLNPIYPSPLIDSGYDVSNYMDIHPLFGSLEDFDKLLQEAHDRNLKVIIDIVLSHSSDQHEWFQNSTNNVEPYSNYYIWSNGNIDAAGKNLPPNDWISTYSDEKGSAWTWNDKKKQWYYHKYHESQPNLNLKNEDVVNEFMNTFNFWMKRGVDGFRVNTLTYGNDDENMENELYAFGLQDNNKLLYTLRAYINSWIYENNASSKLLIVQSSDSADNLITYYGNGTHEGIPPFNFRFITHINSTNDADYIKNTLEEWFNLLPGNKSTNWVLSSHDHSRAASRIGLNRVDGLHMLSLLLPGQAYTYYGEEIAMLDVKLLWNQTIDPMGTSRTEDTYEKYSRDPARTPMQWNSDISAGFSKNKTTYLPVHPEYMDRNVDFQQSQNTSNINIYKKLASLRKNAVFTHGDYELKTLNNNHVLVLKRSLRNYPVYAVVVNTGLDRENVNLTSLYPTLNDNLDVIAASSNAIDITGRIPRDNIALSPNAALVVKGVEEEYTTIIDTETSAIASSTANTPEASSIVTPVTTSTVSEVTTVKTTISSTTRTTISTEPTTQATIAASTPESTNFTTSTLPTISTAVPTSVTIPTTMPTTVPSTMSTTKSTTITSTTKPITSTTIPTTSVVSTKMPMTTTTVSTKMPVTTTTVSTKMPVTTTTTPTMSTSTEPGHKNAADSTSPTLTLIITISLPVIVLFGKY